MPAANEDDGSVMTRRQFGSKSGFCKCCRATKHQLQFVRPMRYGQMCQAQTVIDAPIIVITAYGDPTRGKAIDGGTTALN